MKMGKDTFLAIALGVLVVFSAVQAFQITALKGDLEDGQLSVGTAKKTTSAASSSTGKSTGSLPKSIENLPSMVGGC